MTTMNVRGATNPTDIPDAMPWTTGPIPSSPGTRASPNAKNGKDGTPSCKRVTDIVKTKTTRRTTKKSTLTE